jgi:hypothetical protein
MTEQDYGSLMPAVKQKKKYREVGTDDNNVELNRTTGELKRG